jgi:predicted O-methyltransferase YrrM|tara:strand:+ start:433 stop:1203 length:771 start_codon:yes stop_codon:yes gene_type:complete
MKILILKTIKKLLGIKKARKLYGFLAKSVLRDNQIRHYEPSIIYSKEGVTTTPKLIELVADSAKIASNLELSCGKEDLPDSHFLNVFPGEHYRLLNAIVQVSGAKKIVEIGTYTGMGSLALKAGFNDVNVTTFDIFEWNKLGLPSHFDKSDFSDNLKQIIGDLSETSVFEKHLKILNEADLIFMDAPKNDKFEYTMATKFAKLECKDNKLLILDDIQFVNMIDFWRSIKSPKVDASAFGHFSGTGIVDISNGFKFR